MYYIILLLLSSWTLFSYTDFVENESTVVMSSLYIIYFAYFLFSIYASYFSIKTQKKMIVIGIILLFIPLLTQIPNPLDYARITDVDYKAVVVDEENSQGKVLITERLTFDVHAFSKNNTYWELWRELPENEVDGVTTKYKVNSVKQILDDGTELVYTESPKLYWDDNDYVNTNTELGPGKYFHSEGPYNEYTNNYECVLFYVDDVYREKMVFEIEYEMTNAALRYNDSSELYLSFYSGNTIKYLNSFKAQVLIPDKDMPRIGNYSAHTYGTNSNTFPFTESDLLNPGYHTFSIDLDKSDLKFRPYNEYIELAVIAFGDDKHIFAEHASNNMFSNTNVLDDIHHELDEYKALPSKYVFPKFLIFVVCSSIAYLVIWYVRKLDKKIKKKYLYKPEIDYQYFRDIPSNLDPYFAARLVFCKTKPNKKIEDEYAAIMLSLVQKKYIELDRIDPNKDYIPSNIRIIIKYNSNINGIFSSETNEAFSQELQNQLEPLTVTEKYYFNLIEKHSRNYDTWRGTLLSKFQESIKTNISSTSTFVTNIIEAEKKIGTTEGYFNNSDYKKYQNKYKTVSYVLGIIGLLSLILFNILSYPTRYDFAFGAYTVLGLGLIYSAYYLYQQSKTYILLTQFGENEYAKWKGLYNFLNSDTLMNERTVIELPIWEKYLVYATAFGISQKVIAAINVRYPEYILENNTSMLGNTYFFSRSFHHYNHSFTSHTRSAYTSGTSGHSSYGGYRAGGYSSGYSGGYGGHSGYGGGGRGGGGGRRRSLKLRN